MKKYLSLLAFVLVVSLAFTGVGFAKNDNTNLDKIQKHQKIVKEKDEILKTAEEFGFENPENIAQIIFSYDNYKEEETAAQEPTMGTQEWGAEEIFFKNITSSETRGELLRSSYYVYPGGTMTVTDSVSASFTTTVGLSAEVVSAEIGFSVTASYSVSDSQNVSVPYGKTYNVKAYANNQKKSFEIWEDDVWYDDYLGTGATYKPIGVIFVIYQ